MKKIYFGSNLKMYKGIKDTQDYLQELSELTQDISREEVELFIIPSYTTLSRAVECCNKVYIKIGAQNMCWEEQGQFTGEISVLMLQELGVDLVMVGHSERRRIFKEKNLEENKKIRLAIKQGFKALLCVGETKEERQFGIGIEILRTQLKVGFYNVGIKDIDKIMVAYEPVWSIGVNGTPASAEYAEKMHKEIKRLLVEMFGGKGKEIPVLYGGSVNQSNANELIVQPSIDGLFIGRAAWCAKDFNAIIRNVLGIYK